MQTLTCLKLKLCFVLFPEKKPIVFCFYPEMNELPLVVLVYIFPIIILYTQIPSLLAFFLYRPNKVS